MEIDVTQKIKQQKERRRKETLLALLLMSPFLIIFILFSLVPVASGFVFSFMKYNPYDPGNNRPVGFENYQNLFMPGHPISKLFWDSFSTMFLFDLVTVPLLIVIPLALAYLVNMQPPGYKLFRAIIYLPSVVSITIVGIIFGNMFEGNEQGLINAIFGTKIDWMGGKPWEGDTLRWLVMLIASIWWQTGTNFVIFSGALRDVPKSLYEACEMDGGGRWKRILYVTFPNIRSSITICLFNTLIGYLGLYGQPYTLNTMENQSIFVSPMMFLQNYLMGGLTYAKQTGYLCAATIVFGLIVMFFGIVQRIVTSPRKKRTKHAETYAQFVENRVAFAETGAVGGENHE